MFCYASLILLSPPRVKAYGVGLPPPFCEGFGPIKPHPDKSLRYGMTELVGRLCGHPDCGGCPPSLGGSGPRFRWARPAKERPSRSSQTLASQWLLPNEGAVQRFF